MTPERFAEIRANRASERYSCGRQGCYGYPAEDDVDDLLAHIDTLTAERDAYKRAKEENDERAGRGAVG
jgi:hypothetical protein